MQVQVPAEQVNKEIAARLKDHQPHRAVERLSSGQGAASMSSGRQFGPQVHREVIGELLQSSYEAGRDGECNSRRRAARASSRRAWMRVRTSSMSRPSRCFPEVVIQPIEGSMETRQRVTAEVSDSRCRCHDPALASSSRCNFHRSRVAPRQLKRQSDHRFRRLDRRRAVCRAARVRACRHRLGRRPHAAAVWSRGLVGAIAPVRSADVTVNFPADYRATELAGKEAIFATDGQERSRSRRCRNWMMSSARLSV